MLEDQMLTLPWRDGIGGGAIVCDADISGTSITYEHLTFYGGVCVLESCPNRVRDHIIELHNQTLGGMEFKHKLPKVSGYYWAVDMAYPIPQIAYVQAPEFWIWGRKYQWPSKYIAFGDSIPVPDTRTNILPEE